MRARNIFREIRYDSAEFSRVLRNCLRFSSGARKEQTKRNKVAISPHQVAWHMSHPSSTYVLVHYVNKKNKKNFNEYRLYPGSRIEDLFRLGMNLEPLVLGSLEDCACHLLQLEPVPVV